MKACKSVLIAILVSFVLSSFTLAKAPIDRTQLPQPTGQTEWALPTIETWSLSNGMTVWLLKSDVAPLISLSVILPNGTGSDPADKAGLTSFMVDMMDEGAGERDAIALSDAFQLLATDFSAGSSLDGVYFDVDLLADTLDESLALLSDVVRRPAFTQADFDRRKEQRMASALASEANPSAIASLIRRQALYCSGYAGLPAFGVRTTIDAITLQDIQAQYAALVQPSGGTIVAVGAVDRATLNAALENTFGDWSGTHTVTKNEAACPDDWTPGGLHLVDFPGSEQSMVIFARRVPGTDDPDYFKAQVFNRPFAGSFTGRVNMNLREDKGYTYGARGGFGRSRHAGSYLIYAKVKRDTTRASIDEIIKELSGIRSDAPLTEQEVKDAIGGLQKAFPGRFEKLDAVASQLGTLVLNGHPVEWFRDWSQTMGSVSLTDAQAMAQKYTDPNGFDIVVVGDLSKIGDSLKSLGRPVTYYTPQGRTVDAPGNVTQHSPAQ